MLVTLSDRPHVEPLIDLTGGFLEENLFLDCSTFESRRLNWCPERVLMGLIRIFRSRGSPALMFRLFSDTYVLPRQPTS